ncbi:unnamed protein product [Prunus armeniaca]
MVANYKETKIAADKLEKHIEELHKQLASLGDCRGLRLRLLFLEIAEALELASITSLGLDWALRLRLFFLYRTW